MSELIARFLQSSHADPVYLITGILDIAAVHFGGKLKLGLSNTQRALYKAVIVVAVVLTAACLSKIFGLINSWKELRPIWDYWRSLL